MSRNTFIRLIACFSGSILVICVLQFLTAVPNQDKNSFVRLFPPHFLVNSRTIQLNGTEYYLAGSTDSFLYLGRYGTPGKLLRARTDLSDTTSVTVILPSTETGWERYLHMTIDSPYLYCNNHSTGTISRGRIKSSFVKVDLLFKSNISTTIFLPGGSAIFAVRTIDRQTGDNVLGTVSMDSPSVILKPKILEKQKEGIFSTDGTLTYDRHTKQFVYIYYYRNQFMCMDSLLSLKYRSHTIDTNTTAKIRVASTDNNETTMFASPNYQVNRSACMDARFIYVNSELLADNEEHEISKIYTAVDAYALSNGKYHFSFYLPRGNGKISSMTIIGDQLFTIQKNMLSTYFLNLKELK